MAPVRALAEEFGYQLVPEVPVVGTIGVDEANLGCSLVLQRTCEYVAEVAEAVRDQKVDALEHVRLRKKVALLEEEVARLKQSLELAAEIPEAR